MVHTDVSRTLNTGWLIAGKGGKVKMAMRIDKPGTHARSSLLNVVSLAWGALLATDAWASLATGAGGTTTGLGTTIFGV